jgi:ribosomal protein S18 acetylase RimI-like enzyme
VHSLAIRRPVAGRGLGLRMLRWAERMAAAAGKRYVRLDCWGENAALRRYYERAGYTSRGELTHGGWVCALFERQVSDLAGDVTHGAAES